LLGIGERKNALYYGVKIHETLGDKMQNGLHVASFGSAYIARRVINAFFFVIWVVAAGSIGAGKAHIQLFHIEFIPV
jgi:hypothetical protein